MIKILSKPTDNVIDRWDRPFFRKRRFTGIWHDWALSFTLSVIPLFESEVEVESIFGAVLSNRSLLAADSVGRIDAADGLAGSDTNLVVNGTFEDTSEWVWGAGWQHQGSGPTGKSYWEEQAGSGNLEQNVGVITGHTYQAVFTLSGFEDDAGVKCEIGGTQGADHYSAGTFTEILTAVNTGNLKFIGLAGASGVGYVFLDNVYVYDITAFELVCGVSNIALLKPDEKIERA